MQLEDNTMIISPNSRKILTSGVQNIRNYRIPGTCRARKNVRESGNLSIFGCSERSRWGERSRLRRFHTLHTHWICDSLPSFEIVALVMRHDSHNCIMVLIFNMVRCRSKIFVQVLTSTIFGFSFQRWLFRAQFLSILNCKRCKKEFIYLCIFTLDAKCIQTQMFTGLILNCKLHFRCNNMNLLSIRSFVHVKLKSLTSSPHWLSHPHKRLHTHSIAVAISFDTIHFRINLYPRIAFIFTFVIVNGIAVVIVLHDFISVYCFCCWFTVFSEEKFAFLVYG